MRVFQEEQKEDVMSMDWETLYVGARRMCNNGRMSEADWKTFCMVTLELMVDDFAKAKEKEKAQAYEEAPISFGFGELLREFNLEGFNDETL